MQGIIYVATNTINGKRYVGQTTGPMMTRWKRHLSDALGAKRRRHPLHDAIRKYGRDAWTVASLFEVDSLDVLNGLEAAGILALGTLHPSGYNMRHGGGNAPVHPETRRKLADALRGRTLPAEVIAKLRATHRAREQTPAQIAGLALGRALAIAGTGKPRFKHTSESRAAMSATRRGRPKSAAHRAAIGAAQVGMKRSEETRRKISEAGLRRAPVTDATRAKLSAALAGKERGPMPESQRRNLSIAKRRAAAEKKANVGLS